MKRMPQHADTDLQIKTPAVLTPRRSRMFSHEPFIINTQKWNKTTFPGWFKCSIRCSSCVNRVFQSQPIPPISIPNPPRFAPKKPTSHINVAAFNASITGEEPRKWFAIGLTVEQISQCRGSWRNRDVKSTKTIPQESRKSPVVLRKGKSQINNVQSVGNQVRSKNAQDGTAR